MPTRSTGVMFDLDVYLAMRELKLMRSIGMGGFINDTLRAALQRDFPAIYGEARSKARAMR